MNKCIRINVIVINHQNPAKKVLKMSLPRCRAMFYRKKYIETQIVLSLFLHFVAKERMASSVPNRVVEKLLWHRHPSTRTRENLQK